MQSRSGLPRAAPRKVETIMFSEAMHVVDGSCDWCGIQLGNRTFHFEAKRYCCRMGFQVCDDAMQIHGGIGVTEGTRVSRLWRDARGHRFGGGTDEIMVHIIGRQIVKEHTPR
jgi:alkylation response protein AidB-like acyl-CoA dehydrogenase